MNIDSSTTDSPQDLNCNKCRRKIVGGKKCCMYCGHKVPSDLLTDTPVGEPAAPILNTSKPPEFEVKKILEMSEGRSTGSQRQDQDPIFAALKKEPATKVKPELIDMLLLLISAPLTIVILLSMQFRVKRWGYISGGALACDSIIFGALVLSFGRAAADAAVYAWLLPTYFVSFCAMWALFYRRRQYATNGVLFGFSLSSMLFASWGVVWILVGYYGVNKIYQDSRSGLVSEAIVNVKADDIASVSEPGKFQYLRLNGLKRTNREPIAWIEALGARSASDVINPKKGEEVAYLIDVSSGAEPLLISSKDINNLTSVASLSGVLETVTRGEAPILFSFFNYLDTKTDSINILMPITPKEFIALRQLKQSKPKSYFEALMSLTSGYRNSLLVGLILLGIGAFALYRESEAMS